MPQKGGCIFPFSYNAKLLCECGVDFVYRADFGQIRGLDAELFARETVSRGFNAPRCAAAISGSAAEGKARPSCFQSTFRSSLQCRNSAKTGSPYRPRSYAKNCAKAIFPPRTRFWGANIRFVLRPCAARSWERNWGSPRRIRYSPKGCVSRGTAFTPADVRSAAKSMNACSISA